ncbi:Lrp/AsnC family transcriptional regulator [Subtercola frigoramans]|uniref:DNA-binding Lrp family transcriptional regulator n=1 Tax=Subtercola frigoramans TaxID=120298 RepID=A0ABS2L129_9MICO|nr:winged helix-turn-helix transcriptional regulator [Subtercola frigoramans]MBM7470786.1 DNA-binding Lrp family transcriptional regulator [Subtercola frigoramans]
MLDPIDQAIVSHLESDPRVTSRRIADSTGIAESTVRGRLQRLIGSGLVSSTIFVHPELTGASFLYQVKLTLEPGTSATDVSELPEFSSSPWTALVPTDGRLVAQYSAATLAEMLSGVDRIRRLPGVLHAETVVVTRIYVGTNWSTGPGEHHWPSTPIRAVDPLDEQLIDALRPDGRMSYTELSTRIGLTVPATRRRVLRLVEDGVIRFVTRVNDPSIAHVEASIDLAVTAASRAAIIDQLCARTSVRYVVEQTGPYDLACYLVADSVAALAIVAADITADDQIIASRTDPFVVLRDETSWVGGVG